MSDPIEFEEFFDFIMNSMRSFIKADFLCTRKVMNLISFLYSYDEGKKYSKLYTDHANSYLDAFIQNTQDLSDIKEIKSLFEKIR